MYIRNITDLLNMRLYKKLLAEMRGRLSVGQIQCMIYVYEARNRIQCINIYLINNISAVLLCELIGGLIAQRPSSPLKTKKEFKL